MHQQEISFSAAKNIMGNLGYGFRPVHPGELLKDEIEYRGIPQRKLAEQMGVSPTILNDILNCRRPLSTNMAMLFEAALDISAGLTMRMQLKYNMQVAQKNKIFVKRLNEIRKVVAVL